MTCMLHGCEADAEYAYSCHSTIKVLVGLATVNEYVGVISWFGAGGYTSFAVT